MLSTKLPPSELVARIAAQRRVVRRHKATLSKTREELRAAATNLAALEAECRERGIRLIVEERNTQC